MKNINLKTTKFHWINNYTGEIVPHIWDVFKTVLHDTVHYHFIKENLNWSYSKQGH